MYINSYMSHRYGPSVCISYSTTQKAYRQWRVATMQEARLREAQLKWIIRHLVHNPIADHPERIARSVRNYIAANENNSVSKLVKIMEWRNPLYDVWYSKLWINDRWVIVATALTKQDAILLGSEAKRALT